MNDKIYPSMVIRSQAEAIELLEKENEQLKKQKEELVKFLDQIIKKLNEAEFADELFSPIGVKKTSYALKMVLDKINELEGVSND